MKEEPMYSITDAHKALSCGRSTVYSIMKEAGIETTKSGLSQLMTDEQFQRLQELYFEKYPNRKPKEFIKKLENNKLLTMRAGENVVRILPPLNVKKQEIDLAIKIIRKVSSQLN